MKNLVTVAGAFALFFAAVGAVYLVDGLTTEAGPVRAHLVSEGGYLLLGGFLGYVVAAVAYAGIEVRK